MNKCIYKLFLEWALLIILMSIARKEMITHRAIVIIDPKRSRYSKGLSDIVALIVKEPNPRDSSADATTTRCAFFASPEISIRSVVHSEVTPSIRFSQVGAPVRKDSDGKRRKEETFADSIGIQKCKLLFARHSRSPRVFGMRFDNSLHSFDATPNRGYRSFTTDTNNGI